MEIRALAAAVAWTTAVALAIARITTGMQGMTVWALLVGHAAMVLTGWHIVECLAVRLRSEIGQESRALHERTVERVASKLAAALRDGGNVSSLR